MMAKLKFSVPGIPETKGSWKAIGGGRLKRDNPREKAWSTAVAWAAKAASFAALGGRAPSGPSSRRIRAVIDCYLPTPKGNAHKRDLDKLARSILDALTGLLYKDDEQVDELHIRKVIRDKSPGADVTIEELAGEPASAAQSLIVAQVLDERHRQDEKWGGADHDDEHEARDWLAFIDEHRIRARKVINDRDAFRQRLIVIAALAIAGIESIDRGGLAGV